MKVITILLMLSFTGCTTGRFLKTTESMLNSNGAPTCPPDQLKVFDVVEGKVESDWKASCGEKIYSCNEKMISNTRTVSECSTSNPNTSFRVERTVENKKD